MTDLGQRVQTAGTDAVRDFKASQSFIDSCAEYYGTGFDDYLKQVASAFPELDLFGITMDDEVTVPLSLLQRMTVSLFLPSLLQILLLLLLPTLRL